MTGQEAIGEFLAASIRKDVLLDFQSRAESALDTANSISAGLDAGHQNSFRGLARHFLLNEALDKAFAESDLPRNGVKANRIVTGECGAVRLARLHLNKGPWDNSRRSVGKLKLCERNRAARAMIQGDLLEGCQQELTEITAFFVTEGDGSPDSPFSMFVVVPDDNMDMKNPLFVEPVGVFLHRYEKVEAAADMAHPKLKAGVVKKAPEAQSDDT